MTFNIWIDDMRKPHKSMDNLHIFLNAENAISWIDKNIKENDIIIFYLDHDLGEGLSGYNFAKWFVEWNYEKNIPMAFHILSANPVGVFNIRQLLTHYGYGEF